MDPEPGAMIASTKNTAPSVYTDLFFTDEFLHTLATETDRYATQVLSTRRLQRSSRLKDWRETNKEEMKIFIAIVLHMGIIQLPQKPLYWSTHKLYDIPIFRSLMSRNRFQIRFRFFTLQIPKKSMRVTAFTK